MVKNYWLPCSEGQEFNSPLKHQKLKVMYIPQFFQKHVSFVKSAENLKIFLFQIWIEKIWNPMFSFGKSWKIQDLPILILLWKLTNSSRKELSSLHDKPYEVSIRNSNFFQDNVWKLIPNQGFNFDHVTPTESLAKAWFILFWMKFNPKDWFIKPLFFWLDVMIP